MSANTFSWPTIDRRAMLLTSCVVFCASVVQAAATIHVLSDQGTIAGAIAAAASGDTIIIDPGTYSENVVVNKQLFIQGAQAGTNACERDPNGETVLTGSGVLLDLKSGAAGTVINGLTFSGGTTQIQSSSGPIDNLQILSNRFVAFTGSGIFLNDNGTDITVDQNLVNGIHQIGGGGIVHLDQDNFDGFHFTNNCVSNGSTGLFVDGTRNVGANGVRTPLFSGNVFSGNEAGMNLGRGAVEDAEISDNIFRNNDYDGLQGGPANTTISGNTFIGNDRYGIALTAFGKSVAPYGAKNSSLTQNCFMSNDTGVYLSTSQELGTIGTNVLNNNNLLFNITAGASYGGTETIDASNDYWGAADGPSGDGPGSGDAINGTSIGFTPFETALLELDCNSNLPHVLECVGFAAPANKGPITVKKNRVIPFKAELIDVFTGMPVSDSDLTAAPVIQVIYDSGIAPAEDVSDDSLPAGQGSDTNEFVFGGSDWTYNLLTKNYSASGTYEVSMASGDENEYTISPVCSAEFVIP